MLRITMVQSSVLGPVVFITPNATKTFEYKAEKLTSTCAPQRNIRHFLTGSSKEEKVVYQTSDRNGTCTTTQLQFAHQELLL